MFLLHFLETVDVNSEDMAAALWVRMVQGEVRVDRTQGAYMSRQGCVLPQVGSQNGKITHISISVHIARQFPSRLGM